MLSTDVLFKASDSLKDRILEKAAREEPVTGRARTWKWARWAMPVAAAALTLAVLVTVKPGVPPAIAAEKLEGHYILIKGSNSTHLYELPALL